MTRVAHEPLISFACGPDGAAASIEDVPSGLACQCTCFACKKPLVARKGQIRRWSFAHESTGNFSCEWAAETALHYAMKEIIAQERCIFVPTLEIAGERKTSYGETVQLVAQQQGKLVALDTVELEYSVHPIRPDVVAYAGGHRLFIEVIVTHAVDEEKQRHIRQLGASAITIDLSKHDRIVDRHLLRQLLLSAAAEKGWLFHRQRERLEFDLFAELDRRVSAKEAEYAERVKRRLDERQREKALLYVSPPVAEDMPFADGAVMCFRLLRGGEAYLKRSPQGALTLEYTRQEDIDVPALTEIGLARAEMPTLWNIAEHQLIYVIPYLNRNSVSTTNRSRSEYMKYRYQIGSDLS
ncbi:hypothetical protein [Noviherbaspirillum malthae]|uniref:hypothetical protein n=1 Tax=Noviherbaspirillum malthae TaxID=1260987 RepID=UPI00188DE04E|nr:hypothetical protein [Noviherbaspirillum malthae]